MIRTAPIYALSVSWGNDSLAMLQWAHDIGLGLWGKVYAVYCDTGWAKPGWEQRVEQGEAFARQCGFEPVHLKSIGMEELVRTKKGWPGNGQQFCTAHLKGVPFLEWIDEVDPQREAVVLIGKRRAESEKRKDTPEFVEQSEYHGDRCIWHPLYLHSHEDRNATLASAGILPPPADWNGTHDKLYLLPHRSDECSPCVNANRGDINRLGPDEMAKVNRIECGVGKPMFRPKRFNGMGIYGVVMWARYGKNHEADIPEEESGCGSPFGCETSF